MAPNTGPEITAVGILFLVLSWLFVSLRVYVRGFMIKSFGMDDWLSVITLILFNVLCVFIFLTVRNGAGQHIEDVPLEKLVRFFKWTWCTEVSYIVVSLFLRASIAVFLSRLCVKRNQKLTLWIVMGVVTVFDIFFFLLFIFRCWPVSFYWNQAKGKTSGKCHTQLIGDASYAFSAVSIISDWTLGFLPIFLVKDLAMNLRTKAIVATILSLGVLGSAATVVRIPYIEALVEGDFPYKFKNLIIWTVVEVGVGITASSIATLRPLFRTFLDRTGIRGSTPRSRTTRKYKAWPLSELPENAGYIRSGSAPKSSDLDFGTNSTKDSGVKTTIQSTSGAYFDEEQLVGSKRNIHDSSTKRAIKWRPTHIDLENSSEEFVTQQDLDGGQIIKTTEVTTYLERQIGKS